MELDLAAVTRPIGLSPGANRELAAAAVCSSAKTGLRRGGRECGAGWGCGSGDDGHLPSGGTTRFWVSWPGPLVRPGPGRLFVRGFSEWCGSPTFSLLYPFLLRAVISGSSFWTQHHRPLGHSAYGLYFLNHYISGALSATHHGSGLYTGFGLGTNLPSGAIGFLFLPGHMPPAQIGTSLMGPIRTSELVASLPTGWAGLLTRI